MFHIVDKFFKRLKIRGKCNTVNYKKNTKGYIKVIGNYNEISFPPSVSDIKIIIVGNNNQVLIDKEAKLHKVSISVGRSNCPVNNCKVHIGTRTESGKAELLLMEDNSSIKIGKDCMFASNINIWCTDVHAICDLSGNVQNIGKAIEIGDRVWIGTDVKIGKNTQISNDSVIGWNSVVTRKFTESNVVIAGNPAQIVKRNIVWDNAPPKFCSTLINKKGN